MKVLKPVTRELAALDKSRLVKHIAISKKEEGFTVNRIFILYKRQNAGNIKKLFYKM